MPDMLRRTHSAHWQWPLPAVLVWALCWLLFRALVEQGWALHWALGAASALGVASSLWGATWWRRLLIAGGFPLSLAVSLSTLGAEALPSWAWLLPLGLLLLVYPVNAWRDAPLFPTPRNALLELPAYAPLPVGAHVLDAGCGLGHGLLALRRAYPQAEMHGMEWSWPLRLLCGLRCPWALVTRADIWQANWGTYDMVYMFQRPESMDRALAKARAELRPGAWLVSLEFEATRGTPVASWPSPDGRMVWAYQAPMHARPGETE
jgi:hypothetical protein